MKFSVLIRIFLCGVVLFSPLTTPCVAQSPIVSNQKQAAIGFRLTKVEYRDDLTRIYGELLGTPHTAARIDDMTLVIPGGKSFKWTDIDGIDANRYFQWEDSGRISIEIDFPPLPRLTTFSIKASGPAGESLWPLKAPAAKVSKNKKKQLKRK